jgi:hypothetical protein
MSNEEILELGLTPNQYFLAECIYHKRKDLIEKLLKIDSEDKIKNDLYKLYIKGFLNCDLCEAYTFKIDSIKVEGLFNHTKEIKKDNNAFVKELYEIFPAGITTGGSMSVRSGFKDFSNKLDKFRKDNRKYNDEVIKKAFQLYVSRCKESGYQYMKQIGYFVYKNNESVLEGVCEEVINNPDIRIKESNMSNTGNMEAI